MLKLDFTTETQEVSTMKSHTAQTEVLLDRCEQQSLSLLFHS